MKVARLWFPPMRSVSYFNFISPNFRRDLMSCGSICRLCGTLIHFSILPFLDLFFYTDSKLFSVETNNFPLSWMPDAKHGSRNIFLCVYIYFSTSSPLDHSEKADDPDSLLVYELLLSPHPRHRFSISRIVWQPLRTHTFYTSWLLLLVTAHSSFIHMRLADLCISNFMSSVGVRHSIKPVRWPAGCHRGVGRWKMGHGRKRSVRPLRAIG